jgi:hypothetical protein
VRLARAAAALLLAACGSVPPEPLAPAVSRPAATSFAAGPTTPATRPSLASGWTVPVPRLWRAPNGCVLLASPAQELATDRAALLHVLLPFGSGHGRVGIAELTAHCLADVVGGAEGTPSLRTALHQVGGTLHVQVGPGATAVDVVLPAARWQEGLGALVAALQRTRRSRDQVDAVRERLLAQWRDRLSRPGLEAVVARFTQLRGGRADEFLAHLQDRDPDEVEQFHRLHVTSAGAVVGLWVPGLDPDEALAKARTLVAPWLSESAPRPPAPESILDSLQGVHWAAGDGADCEVALLIPLLPPAAQQAAEHLVLIEAWTMAGVGGRLGESLAALVRTDVALFDQIVRDGAGTWMLLAARAHVGSVGALYQSCQASLRSLVAEPPSLDQIELAAARARLQVLARASDPRGWLDLAATHALRTGQALDLRDPLARLEAPAKLDLEPVAAALARRPPVVLVAGATPPPDAPVVQLQGAFLAAAGATQAPTDLGQQVEAARPHVALLLRACGGRDALATVHGFCAEGRRYAEHGPEVRERLWFAEPGRLRRVRGMLATSVETVVGDGAGSEIAGQETATLSADERAALLATLRSQPPLLLAALARDEIQLRLVAQRTIADRKLALLEATGGGERLRLYVDVEHGLLRAVETHEQRAGVGRVLVHTRFDDYRSAGRLRLPFRSIATVDEGSTVTVEWTRLIPGAPGDDCLLAGGDAGPLGGER